MSIIQTQNGWINDDAFGAKRAQELGMQLQDQANKDAEFKTSQILQNQNMSVADIMNHLNLARVANPVDASGNVAVPAQPASLQQNTMQMGAPPQPGDGNAIQDSATLDQLRNLPATSASLDPSGGGITQNPVGDQSGASLSSMLSIPQTQTTLNPGAPATTRPADISRTVTYSDGQGNKSQYEMKDPADIAAVDAAATRAKFRATAIPMNIDPATQKSMGVTLPDQIWVDPDHLAQYMGVTGQSQPIPTSKEAQAAGLPPTVPLRNLGQVVSVMNNQNIQNAANQRNAANNDTKVSTNAATNATRTATNANTNTTRTGIAQGNNATAVQVANIRKPAGAGGQPTPGQQGVQNRFNTAQANKKQQQLQAVQAQEDQVHAVRMQLGQDLANPNITDAQKQQKLGQLKTATFQVQQYQTRKAAILGAQTPSAADQAKIPEGTQGPGPDGHIWRKQGGVVYLVQ